MVSNAVACLSKLASARVHSGVGVAEKVRFDRGHQVMDKGAAAGDLPEGSASGELADDLGLGVGEAEGRLDERELVGRLAEDDLRGGVGQEAGGDLGGRAAVVGLGSEV